MTGYLEADERLERQLNILYRKTAIASRNSVLPDFHDRYENLHLFNGHVPNVVERMKIFSEKAPGLAIDAIDDCIDRSQLNELTHLITVSCTGLSAPGLEIKLAESLGLSPTLTKLSVNFMGCYAAFHALKIADAICRAEQNAKVLIVCVELCSIHFLKSITEDNLRANALFADGAAAVLMQSQPDGENLEIKSFYNELLSQGKQDMTWEIGNEAFAMRLTSYIPNLVKSGIGNLLQGAMKELGLQEEDISHWAIHPGGKKIVDTVEKEMHLSPADLTPSREVLAKYGNMSSPTVLFVLKQMLDEGMEKGSNVFAAGFGPGLTLESCILQKG